MASDPRFHWTKEQKPDGEVVWRFQDGQKNQSGSLKDMGNYGTADDGWHAYLDWKTAFGSPYTDPLGEFLKESKMYPGEYVKVLAEDIARNGLRLPLRRWLWLRFHYGMLQHPTHPSGLYPFQNVTYAKLLQGAPVADRDKLYTEFLLRLTVITFWIYSKLPGTYYQKWKLDQEQQCKQREVLQRKTMFRDRNV
jgi:hypothetical protein